MRRISAALLLAWLANPVAWAAPRPQSPAPVAAAPAPSAQALAHQILDRMSAHERALISRLRHLSPRIETYLQNFRLQPAGRELPESDRYYLGRLQWRDGDFQTVSFVADAAPSWLTSLGPISGGLASPVAHLFRDQPAGRNGFSAMLFPDVEHFDRAHYEFAYVRRVFLGDVRCYVFDVAPRRDRNGFWGRVWIEDQGDFLVRFNGTFFRPRPLHPAVHFDSWRFNVAPDLWIPAFVYSEESNWDYGFARGVRFRAQTRVWGYNLRFAGNQEQLTQIAIEDDAARDPSMAPHHLSPVESYRAWQRQAEDNLLDRLERAGLLAPSGEVDRVLATVTNNLIVTNHLQIEPPVRCRVLMTTPLESMAIGHTIVLSRGLIDTLPNEASLAAILAHELGHIALGQTIDSDFAFSDRMLFPDRDIYRVIQLQRPRWQERQADQRALQLLDNSPYKNQLGEAGLYLRALMKQAGEANLVGSHLANGLFVNGYLDRLAALVHAAPRLQPGRLDQIAALPLGAWVHLDPWTDQLTLETAPRPHLLSALEKMPFEVTPLIPYLRRVSATANSAAPSPLAYKAARQKAGSAQK